ncbi:MAG: type IV pilus twitching motility protein PilT [Coraliomargarita sp.]
MTEDLKLFACLCIDQGILDRATVYQLGQQLGQSTELFDFAQDILNDGHSDNLEAVQDALNAATEQHAAGQVATYNPFEAQNDTGVPPISERPKIKLNIQSKAEPAATSAPFESEPAHPRLAVGGDVNPTWVTPSDYDAADPHAAREGMTGLLLAACKDGASDLHISADSRIFIRKNRSIEYKSEAITSARASEHLNLSLLTEKEKSEFLQHGEYDFALPLDSGQRFRVNLMKHRDGIAGTYRIVPATAPSLEALGFPNADRIKELLAYHNGLVLVTGPVGAGKTTTLSALVSILNQTREDHVITVEEPIEIIHHSDQCSITQRAVGPHTKTFKSALKGALRQDPDIIVIGEMRDLETIEMAISASETGHLVIGTMHTSDAATTLNRLLDVFPPAQQAQIRAMVAESLRGVICQRLLPSTDGGVALASELLLQNLAVSALIREGKTQGLGNVMETGRRAGMVQMDASVFELWQAGRITSETALANIRNEHLRQQIR